MTTTTVKPLSDVGLVFSTDGPLSTGNLKVADSPRSGCPGTLLFGLAGF